MTKSIGCDIWHGVGVTCDGVVVGHVIWFGDVTVCGGVTFDMVWGWHVTVWWWDIWHGVVKAQLLVRTNSWPAGPSLHCFRAGNRHHLDALFLDVSKQVDEERAEVEAPVGCLHHRLQLKGQISGRSELLWKGSFPVITSDTIQFNMFHKSGFKNRVLIPMEEEWIMGSVT